MSERKLNRELKVGRPFDSLEHEAFLNLAKTASELSHQFTILLRPRGLSVTTYNVLRILRGAGESGRTCGEIAGRMVTRVPDVTRLLDRLERDGLVVRERDADDRRVVTTRITERGRELTDRLDGPVNELHRSQLRHLGEDRLRALIHLLEEARSQPE